jgi:DNA-binding LacI/PurR family transcriptional regulator
MADEPVLNKPPALSIGNQATKGRRTDKPRIKDVAEQLGVSMALNDKPGVADDLRRRVLELAAELEFTPNMAARQLLELIHTERQSPVKSVVATTIVARMSCGCAAK